MSAIADNISDFENVVVAYEPVWAIGTGKVGVTHVHAADTSRLTALWQWLGLRAQQQSVPQLAPAAAAATATVEEQSAELKHSTYSVPSTAQLSAGCIA